MATKKKNSTVKKEDECHDEDHEILEWVFEKTGWSVARTIAVWCLQLDLCDSTYHMK
jgi:hypothetical protein